MKRILLVLALAFGTSTFAQIEVTETVKPETIYLQAMGFHGLYKTKLNDSTYVYSMTFKDSQYQQISSYETIYFETIDDMKQFFNIVLSVLESKEDKTLKFLDQTVDVRFSSNVVKVYEGSSFCYFNKKWAQRCLDALQ
jgi:hypothetical protein